MTKTILVINTGSSSVKASLFAADAPLTLMARKHIDRIGSTPQDTHENALRAILDWSKEQNGSLSAVAHRVVHGGDLFSDPVAVTPPVLEQLRRFSPLVPLHQPNNLLAIEIFNRLRPELLQIACFDTAFHAGHDPLFTAYALPKSLADKGIRRYGFHGLSYEWVSHVLRRDDPELAGGRVIVAHLGSGASLCALLKGKSIDSTLGMTALDGLPMGTRCGSLDPGALIYMMRDLKISPDEVERLLHYDSGLKGLSGITNDVRTLLASKDPKAAFAIDYFCLKTAQFMGMMAVSLGGVDGIVFTGGVGENAAPVRDAILARVGFLGTFKTLIVPADEERVMAMHAMQYMSGNGQRRKEA
ncbi:MAG: acetate kinase [Pseudomonadota bacterium]